VTKSRIEALSHFLDGCRLSNYLAHICADYVAHQSPVEDLSAIPQDARDLALQRFNLLSPYLEGARPLRSVTGAHNQQTSAIFYGIYHSVSQVALGLLPLLQLRQPARYCAYECDRSCRNRLTADMSGIK
jgi:hypothetical protein